MPARDPVDVLARAVDARLVALGVEGSHDFAFGAARLRPYWSLEYWSNVGRNSDALINYVNAPVANDYRLGLTTFSTANWHAGLGADLRLRNGATVSGLVRHEAGGSLGGVTTFGLQLSLNWDAAPGASGAPAPGPGEPMPDEDRASVDPAAPRKK